MSPRPVSIFAIPTLASLLGLSLTGCGPGTPPAGVPQTVFGHCVYDDAMSGSEQCKELRGSGWTESLAEEECANNDVTPSTGGCPYAQADQLGACVLTRAEDRIVKVVVPGDNPEQCNTTQNGCEVFGGGSWDAAPTCGGDVDLDDLYDSENFAVPPYETCVAPLDDAPGLSADGTVCTVTLIGACTEPGRSYPEYGNCEDVRTQQPYYAVIPGPRAADPDPRMSDLAYVEELEWVKREANACACACCHSNAAPDGPSIWDTDASGNWINTFTDFGIAFGASVVDSSLLGSYGPGENNGFTRSIAGIPSTDEARMKAFFDAEMIHRGLSADDFADEPRVPAPFDDQDNFVPQPCEAGEGMSDDGFLLWSGGRARFAYVLDEGTQNPGVPPNRDLPDGTLWRVDTVPPAVPMKTGEVRYGQLPAGHRQVFPVDDTAPSALISGETYVLYMQTDLMLPTTRCTFVAP